MLHADDDIVVVEKGAGILTVPTARGEVNTLVQQLRRHLARGQRFAPRVEVVHRLDRDVSGLLVFARSPAAAEALRHAFAEHRPEREYAALVAGTIGPDSGTFASRLVTGKALQRYSSDREGTGEAAVTHYRVEQRLGPATLVQVRLETGRRNQIRVHFAEAGHPILGETRYRPEAGRHRAWPPGRIALHARLLAFPHPVTGQAMRFESPLPPEFADFLRRVGRRPPPTPGGRTPERGCPPRPPATARHPRRSAPGRGR